MAITPEEAQQQLAAAGIDYRTGEAIDAESITPEQAQQQLAGAGIDYRTGQPIDGSVVNSVPLSDDQISGGMTTVRSTPVSPEEIAWNEWTAKYGQKGAEKDTWMGLLPTGMGVAGSLTFEKAANSVSQGLPPRLKWLSMPLRIGSAIGGAFVGGESGKGLELGARLWNGEDITPEEIRSQQVKAGIREARDEAIGNVVGLGIGKVLTGGIAKGGLIPGIDELSVKLQEAGKRITSDLLDPHTMAMARAGKGNLSLAQKTAVRFIDVLESFSEKSFVDFGSIWRRKELIQPAAHEQLKKEFVGSLWDKASKEVNASDLGKMFTSTLKGQKKTFKKEIADAVVGKTGRVLESAEYGPIASEVIQRNRKEIESLGSNLYKHALDDPRVVGQLVDTKTARDLGEKIAEQAEKAKGLGQTGTSVKAGEAIMNIDESMSIKDLDFIRGSLLEEERTLSAAALASGSKKPRASKDLLELADSIDSLMQNKLQSIDPQLATDLSDARSLWKEKSITFGSTQANTISRTAKNNPKGLVDWIFAPGAIDRVDSAKEVLGEDVFNQMRDTWLSETLETAFDSKNIGGTLSKKFNKMGKENLANIFGDMDQAESMLAAAKAFDGKGKTWLESAIKERAMRAAKNNPDKLSSTLFQPNNLDQIKLYKKELPPDVFNSLVASWGTKAVNKKGITIAVRNMGEETLEAMLGKAHLQDLKDIGYLETLIKAKTTQGGGMEMIPAMIHASAILQMMRGISPETVGFLGADLGASAVIGRVMGNEAASKWLAKGLNDPARVNFYARKAASEVIKTFGQEKRRTALVDTMKAARQAADAGKTTTTLKKEKTAKEIFGQGGVPGGIFN